MRGLGLGLRVRVAVVLILGISVIIHVGAYADYVISLWGYFYILQFLHLLFISSLLSNQLFVPFIIPVSSSNRVISIKYRVKSNNRLRLV